MLHGLIPLKFREESYLGPLLDSCWFVLTHVDLCWYSCIRIDLIIKKCLPDRCFSAEFAKVLRTSILRKICERLLQYFQYNSHHHFHYHHLHYHRKMHLYRLGILLIISLDSLSVWVKFCLLPSGYFSLVLLPLRIRLRPPDKF